MEIRFDENDYERLTTNGTHWGDWAKGQHHRWEHSTEAYDTDPRWDWGYAHWVERWADVVLCRSFLESIGQPYELIYDMAGNDYVILTDWVSPVWRQTDKLLGAHSPTRPL